MLRKSPTGTWLPAWVPESTVVLSCLLMICSIVNSTVSHILPNTHMTPMAATTENM